MGFKNNERQRIAKDRAANTASSKLECFSLLFHGTRLTTGQCAVPE
jgi:hypothetical protein